MPLIKNFSSEKEIEFIRDFLTRKSDMNFGDDLEEKRDSFGWCVSRKIKRCSRSGIRGNHGSYTLALIVSKYAEKPGWRPNSVTYSLLLVDFVRSVTSSSSGRSDEGVTTIWEIKKRIPSDSTEWPELLQFEFEMQDRDYSKPEAVKVLLISGSKNKIHPFGFLYFVLESLEKEKFNDIPTIEDIKKYSNKQEYFLEICIPL